ncbi:SDR family NAD(P)-dependent oxidoreductase [Catenulispora rubra]|uniref:SDR family NAD(P)-dependent oxidoreductase n=1 Tax=Catenulispora rubra TaxID=280293 RepID=UPI002B264D5A|nr:SDR family NAD(P)-dependent oxidoreductase [Catenulispora rubra]
MFPGQGPQHHHMTLHLYNTNPTYHQALNNASDALHPHTTFHIPDLLNNPQPHHLTHAHIVQPMLYATNTALATLWQHHGIHPHTTLGHSQGEIAAATCAGWLTLQDGATITALRSQAITDTLANTGTMAAITLPPDKTQKLLVHHPNTTIAAYNSPTNTIITGPQTDITTIIEHCTNHGIHAKTIPVNYPSHHPTTDALHHRLTHDLKGIRPQQGHTPLHSTLTGQPITHPDQLGPEYWFNNLRHPVQLQTTIQQLAQSGHTHFIEISPHPVLTTALEDTLTNHPNTHTHHTLRRDHHHYHHYLHTLTHTHTTGLTPTWPQTTTADTPPQHTNLPTYPFQHQHHWLPAAKKTASRPEDLGLTTTAHPLLTARADTPEGAVHYTGRIAPDQPGWIPDHAIGDTPVLPGAAVLDLALTCVAEHGHSHLDELTLHAPITVTRATQLHLTLSAPDPDGQRTLTVHARQDDDQPWTLHATAATGPGDADTGTAHTATDVHPELNQHPDIDPTWQPIDLDQLYPTLAARGYHYGPAFQAVTEAHVNPATGQTHTRNRLAEGQSHTGHSLHPTLLDAAFHPQAMPGSDDPAQILLPYSYTGVALHGRPGAALRTTISPGSAENTLALSATDAHDAPALTIQAIHLRPTAVHQLTAAPPLLHLTWTPAEAGTGTGDASGSEDWAAVGDSALACVSSQYPDLNSLIADGEAAPGVLIHVIETRPEDDPDSDTQTHLDRLHQATTDQLTLLTEFLTNERLQQTHLLVTTRHATTAAGTPNPIHAAIWALTGTAQNEHPDRITLLDTDTPDAAVINSVLTSGHAQTAWYGQQLLTPGLERVPDDALEPPDTLYWRLESTARGTLDNLVLAPNPDAARPLDPGEVRVRLQAAGLNFRDVLVNLDMVTGPMTSEAAGVVVQAADDVTAFAPGDQVMGLFASGLGPFAVTDHRALAKFPSSWTAAQAAASPVGYLTAYHCLHDLAGLGAGESVLIHTATGAVGHAAVHIAHHLGATVYATAHPDKWPALLALGIPRERISSSRNLDYEAAFGADTGGRGIDVVLNSLAGEHTDASLRLLAPGGRFVEMGRTDLRDPEAVQAAHPGIVYQPYDLTKVGYDEIAATLAEMAPMFQSGAFLPPPTTSHDMRRAPAALRELSQARHIGKIVLSIEAGFDPAGTVLITGGTGIVAGHIAARLVDRHKVRHLILASRQGPAHPDAEQIVESLRTLGAEPTMIACDTADPDQLATLLKAVDPAHPLTGVVHAAGTLHDAPVTDQTAQSLAAVLRPKADTAAWLHRLTADAPLTQFIVTSSIAATLGAPGQANYAAANAYLDALAHHRRAHHRPATAIAYGLWHDPTPLTAHLTATDHQRMATTGLTTLTTGHALQLLDQALADGRAHLVATGLNNRAAHPHPLLPQARQQHAVKPADGRGPQELAATLARQSTPEQIGTLTYLVQQHAAAVLAHATPKAIDASVTFKDLGFDSLTAVELRNRLKTATGARLTSTLVFDHPTAGALAEHLRSLLAPEHAPAPGADVLAALDRLESTLSAAELSDEPLRGVVRARLRALAQLADRTGPVADDAISTLKSASAEEVFDLIEKLGTTSVSSPR